MNGKPLDAGIFKAYDVRGLVGSEIDARVAYLVARGFARTIAAGEDGERNSSAPASGLRLALGHDMRLSSAELAESFRHGLIDEGVVVVDVGEVATEMLYYAVGSQDLAGGAMVTASHNPKEYNGFKLVKRNAIALSGDSGIQDVRRAIKTEDFSHPAAKGRVEPTDLYPAFHSFALSLIDPQSVRPTKVVLDGFHGMAGPMIGPVLDKLALDETRLNFEPDGTFPVHEPPNPLLEKNRVQIAETVRSTGSELGIAWDGDADRCFFMDERGEFAPGDFVTALLAEALLARHPGATILYDVRASRAVADTIARLGGRSFPNRVGHAFFKTRMRETGAIFGGEVSGHYYFSDFWCADSGTLPVLLMLELLSRARTTLSRLLEPYRSKYFISGEINSTVPDQAEKMREIEAIYADGRISHLDGLSVDYDDWHFNVRPSNTEPLLRLNLEAYSRESMQSRRDEVLAIVRS